MHSFESRFIIGPSSILFAGVYVSTFQLRNFTGWGNEVNHEFASCSYSVSQSYYYYSYNKTYIYKKEEEKINKKNTQV